MWEEMNAKLLNVFDECFPTHSARNEHSIGEPRKEPATETCRLCQEEVAGETSQGEADWRERHVVSKHMFGRTPLELERTVARCFVSMDR